MPKLLQDVVETNERGMLFIPKTIRQKADAVNKRRKFKVRFDPKRGIILTPLTGSAVDDLVGILPNDDGLSISDLKRKMHQEDEAKLNRFV